MSEITPVDCLCGQALVRFPASGAWGHRRRGRCLLRHFYLLDRRDVKRWNALLQRPNSAMLAARIEHLERELEDAQSTIRNYQNLGVKPGDRT